MHTDINTPKTKSVNICFQNVKFNLSIVFFVFVATNLMKDPTANANGQQTTIELQNHLDYQNTYNYYHKSHSFMQNIENLNKLQEQQQNQIKFFDNDNNQGFLQNNVVKRGGAKPKAKATPKTTSPSGSSTDTNSSSADTVSDELLFGNCSIAGKDYLRIIQGGSLVILFVNLILLFYIWCRIHFARAEFWGTYIMNLIWSILLIVFTLEVIGKVPQECPQTIMVQKSVIILVLKKELEVLIFGIMFPREFSTKQTNFASNLIFPYLYLFSGDLSGCSEGSALESQIFEVCFIHIFVLVLGTAFNFALLCIKKNNGQVFKFYVLLGMLVMVVVYGQNFMVASSLNVDTVICTKGKFIQQSYQIISPMSMLSMLLILCTIRPDGGEQQRSAMLDEYQKNVQHEDYVYNIAKSSHANPQDIMSMHQNQNKQMELTKSYGTIFKK